VDPADGPDLGADTALLAAAVIEAGRVALGYFRKDPKVWTKPGDSPVSEADLAVDRLLTERLTGARPGYGWLSEETLDAADRLARGRVFVVDPIDGTRAFIAGDPVWAVSAAIVEAGRPVAAALFQPATGDLMLAASGLGAWRGATRLVASSRDRLAGARVSGPRKYLDRFDASRVGVVVEPRVPSLALRLAYVADGRLDVALASGRSHDWDLAAADLLVHEAGGRLTALDGKPIVYNAVEPRHPPLVAAAPGLAGAALGLLAGLAER
jgi:myo-inositol-1(or 4)-monophosphatase